MKLCYIEKNFGDTALQTIRTAERILEDYERQGFDLTLRQLYYQFVARNLFPADRTWTWTGSKWIRDPKGTQNAEPNYKWLGELVNDARLAGLVDWTRIVDRTRNLRVRSHWANPRELIEDAELAYAIDRWETQPEYLEVWIEKDALVGIAEAACVPLDVPIFSCRGYTSQSEMWVAGQRLLKPLRAGKHVHIIHLGDHDPSGLDMTRDIEDRLCLFLMYHSALDFAKMPAGKAAFKNSKGNFASACKTWMLERFGTQGFMERIALNMDQVRQYDPPPNPTKLSDSRASKYIGAFGSECWELDALEPAVLRTLINDKVLSYVDGKQWDQTAERERRDTEVLKACADNWDAVAEFLIGDRP